MFVWKSYCPSNGTFLPPWQDNGLSPCFYMTCMATLPLAMIIIFGLTQVLIMSKWQDRYLQGSKASNKKRQRRRCPNQEDHQEVGFLGGNEGGCCKWLFCIRPWCNRTFSFVLHTTLSALVILMALVQLFLHDAILYKESAYPFLVFHSVANIISWLFATYLLYKERNGANNYPDETYRHGLPLLLFWFVSCVLQFGVFMSWNSRNLWFWDLDTPQHQIDFSMWVALTSLKSVVFLLGLCGASLPSKEEWLERQCILSNYMQIDGGNDDAEDTTVANATGVNEARRDSTWRGIFRKVRLLSPYIWPRSSCILQLKVLICFFILVAGRVVNLFTPIMYKYIVDSLTPVVAYNMPGEMDEVHGKLKYLRPTNNATHIDDSNWFFLPGATFFTMPNMHTALVFRWDFILIYVALRSLQGLSTGGGFLGILRTQLWIRIQQYTNREMALKLFEHLHNLSLKWHLSKKTGEVLRIIDRGNDSVNNILNYMIFNIGPIIVDIIIGIVYFCSAFNIWFGVIVFACMVCYLTVTIMITEWRTKYRRTMNVKDNAKNGRAVDSLLNFETVKYYGAESYEVQNYRLAIQDYQESEWYSISSLNLLNGAQNVIINIAILFGALLCAIYVVDDRNNFTVGDFVLFCTYILQLYAPLNWFGTIYRMIQQSFIDMENMFDLLDQDIDVVDEENAPALEIPNGAIEFNNVNFHYARERAILKNVSFRVEPGQTVALVGPSGSGKSTIIRLLFRFYDIIDGEITIDGQNIAEVNQTSLRRSIGVVPQDTVLFNNDIRYNIRYGRVDATDVEVENAARAAEIHDRILNFPGGYNTIVGERGLKLSGGEKQRVAIARTLLKAPKIVLLDEATSALDTTTERNIQRSLDSMSQNRTTLVVAHRLSTVVNADQIIVLKEGEIVERGTHHDLLNLEDGEYARLWQQQSTENNEE